MYLQCIYNVFANAITVIFTVISGSDTRLGDDLCRRGGLLPSVQLHLVQDQRWKCSPFHDAFVTGSYSKKLIQNNN